MITEEQRATDAKDYAHPKERTSHSRGHYKRMHGMSKEEAVREMDEACKEAAKAINNFVAAWHRLMDTLYTKDHPSPSPSPSCPQSHWDIPVRKSPEKVVAEWEGIATVRNPKH